jgi:hypothetical protein
MRTFGQLGDFPKGLGCDAVLALLKQEARQPKLARRGVQVSWDFFHSVADEDHGLHPVASIFAPGVAEHLADLGVTAKACDTGHKLGEGAAV